MGVKLDPRSMLLKTAQTATDFFESYCKTHLKSSPQNDAIIFFIHDLTSSAKKTWVKESNWM